MNTGNYLGRREGWGEGSGESWARLQSLLDLVRQEHLRTELSPERRDQLRERLLERLARDEVRRRRRRAFFVAAGAALAIGLMVTLVVRAHAA